MAWPMRRSSPPRACMSAPATAMASSACAKAVGRAVSTALSSSCTTECRRMPATPCIRAAMWGRSSGLSTPSVSMRRARACFRLVGVTPSSAIRQVSSGLRRERSISLRCRSGVTGWLRAQSFIPLMSKMSLEAMIDRVSLASRMVARAWGLATWKSLGTACTALGLMTTPGPAVGCRADPLWDGAQRLTHVKTPARCTVALSGWRV